MLVKKLEKQMKREVKSFNANGINRRCDVNGMRYWQIPVAAKKVRTLAHVNHSDNRPYAQDFDDDDDDWTWLIIRFVSFVCIC